MKDSKQNPLTILKSSHSFFEEILRDLIFSSIQKSFPELSAFTKDDVKIEHPLKENYGDYSTSVAMTLIKDLHKSPKEISQHLVNLIKDLIKEHQSISYKSYKDNKKQLKRNIENILENISIAGSGFINFQIKPSFLITYIDSLLGNKSTDVTTCILKGSRIMVEFADPNPYKEFHIGHLRNISLGESYSRLFESLEATVRRANYQGDVGMHVAKSLWGVSKMDSSEEKLITPKLKAEFLGKAYALGAKAFEEDEDSKKEITELNKKIYFQDRSIIDIWKKYREWSLSYFDTIYARLGTRFERFYFESEVSPNGIAIVNSHIKDGTFEQSDGAVVYKGEKKGLHTRVFIAKEGYPTYEGKDLGLAVLKEKEWPFNLSIIMTGNEQEPYFKVMLAALSDIEAKIAQKTIHISFGMVNLKQGKMSSRTGNVITADWLLNEAKKKIREIMKENTRRHAEFISASSSKGDVKGHVQDDILNEKEIETISERLAVAAVKYSMLKVGTQSDIAFDLDESISLEGDSGPYLMYTFARCKSVFRKLEGMSKGKNSVSNFNVLEFENKELLLSSEELGVLRVLYKFTEIVLEATRNFSPNVLCTYLFDLAQKYNGFYHKHSILGIRGQGSGVRDQQEQVKNFRLWLTQRTSEIIQKGLYLLGIETVERM
ncbi:arginine--tRNA ligase [Candidatus Gottesmanbacteria bacterium RIFCSPHIGHO2_02_FULL_39_11]|uniref:Arginine--tRNA ligase n=1 Tax=Candidatus Gottesmanbacteria bacterium RIFCSPHIGHO2_02_FULL_39_11 TaxID=1798382 RepID=A0A1F5ZNN0_9BACT|nr:MAG: arginine--tRNA ligase [Candidatus Gottesmanbacteria bacterium RIFCSPHIGHO2_02_FULL_39_11]